MTAPSPGILTRFIINLHYPTEDAYVDALAEMMKTEYRAIVEAGFVLQIDCPDLGSCRNNQYRDLTDDEFRNKIAERNIAALNAAIEGLPADRMRLHICWGNYEGPHSFDLPLLKIIDIAFKARIAGVQHRGRQPAPRSRMGRPEDHQDPRRQDSDPGVIDSTTNFVEHPKLVAQRIGRYADIVGRERVIAGVDCGFGTAVRTDPIVADSIVWAKLKALGEGAAIASKRLWGLKGGVTGFSKCCWSPPSHVAADAGDSHGRPPRRKRTKIKCIPSGLARLWLSSRLRPRSRRPTACRRVPRPARRASPRYWHLRQRPYGWGRPGFYRGRWNGGSFGPCWTSTPIGMMPTCGQ